MKTPRPSSHPTSSITTNPEAKRKIRYPRSPSLSIFVTKETIQASKKADSSHCMTAKAPPSTPFSRRRAFGLRAIER